MLPGTPASSPLPYETHSFGKISGSGQMTVSPCVPGSETTTRTTTGYRFAGSEAHAATVHLRGHRRLLRSRSQTGAANGLNCSAIECHLVQSGHGHREPEVSIDQLTQPMKRTRDPGAV